MTDEDVRTAADAIVTPLLRFLFLICAASMLREAGVLPPSATPFLQAVALAIAAECTLAAARVRRKKP